MLPTPILEDYDVSPTNGFLPTEAPLVRLPDPYFAEWENIVRNLQALVLSKRLREVVEKLPVLSTDRLQGEPQWRRAYCLLAFISHAYIWGGVKPAERVPSTIAIPFIATCKHLELPTVATYAAVCLWNWKPIFVSEPIDTLSNLDTIDTFTGSLDEKWFYLISVAIEAKAGPTIPLMLQAMQAAESGNRNLVVRCLQQFAERLDGVVSTLARMDDECDPHVFYHRIRPFLAGSKNMACAGLPNGVVFDDGGPINKQRFVQLSGGSNAQSSIIQFFDLALGVKHRPTGHKPPTEAEADQPRNKKQESNFLLEMRKYMPGKHARFLAKVAEIANIAEFVQERRHDTELAVAYDACLAMLSGLRDKHIQIVSRYIVIKAREADRKAAADQASADGNQPKPLVRINLAFRQRPGSNADQERRDLKGTGGSALIPFLRQARDETGEPAVEEWVRRTLTKVPGGGCVKKPVEAATASTHIPAKAAVQKLAWQIDSSSGGLCLY